MSLEQAQEFIEQVNKDEALAQRLKAVSTEDKDAALAQVVSLAAESGYSFTAAEYEQASTALIEAALADGESIGQDSGGGENAGFLDLGFSDDDLDGWDPGVDL